MNTIALDRERLKEAIESGDAFNGGYVLAVAPNGSGDKIHWAETNRPWNPWPDSWLTISIPALDPCGSGRGSEDAEDMLKCILPPEQFEKAAARHESGEIDWISLAEELAPEDWKINRRESVDWLADAFLAACNGDGTDLNDPNPWGFTYDESGYPVISIDPPAIFEWAKAAGN
jgi:hypothetical protein